MVNYYDCVVVPLFLVRVEVSFTMYVPTSAASGVAQVATYPEIVKNV